MTQSSPLEPQSLGKFWYKTIDDYLAHKGITGEEYSAHHRNEDGILFELTNEKITLTYTLCPPIKKSENRDHHLFIEKLILSFLKEETYFDLNIESDSAEVDIFNFSGEPREYFSGYEEGKSYPAEELIQKVLDYFLAHFNREEGKEVAEEYNALRKESEESKDPEVEIQPEEKRTAKKDETTPSFQRLEIKIDRLLRIAGEHPVTLQGEDAYLKQLYVQAINQDVNNLQILEFEGQRIPYVLVENTEIGGNLGKPFQNLYFVAKDRAPENWQQQIVAYHESLCVKIGHAKAKKRELTLAKHLGREEEYLTWRKEIGKVMK